MAYDQDPEVPITADEAVGAIRAFLAERSATGVLMADALTKVELTEGVLIATWDQGAIGKEKSGILLDLNSFKDLAEFIRTPLAFDNEVGRQIRQHVRQVSVIGPFGVGGLTSREIYERGAGLP